MATPHRLLLLVLLAVAASPSRADPLSDGFRDPPASARPRVWWHWMDGNITKDGIAKDLDWMKRVGIGGVQTFDVALQTPQIVARRLVYMTPEWQDAFRFAAERGEHLGLELAIASSPGWSETGGPWVTPADAMKKLVWSETTLHGGRPFDGRLPAPPDVAGPFQSLGYHDPMGGEAKAPAFYADTAVIAWPVRSPESTTLPVVHIAGGAAVDAARLTDGSLTTGVEVPRGTVAQPTVLLLTFSRPQTMRSATLFVAGAVPPFGDPTFTPRLEAKTTIG